MNDEQVRAFVAIELPNEVRNYLTDLIRELKSVQPLGIRWVRPEGMHLTLKFLGNVPSSLLPEVEAGVSRGCTGMDPFELGLDGFGVFPNKTRPRVIWVGVAGNIKKLASLQEKVDREMEALGFARESRPFSPHLTLGRVEESAPVEVRHKIVGLIDTVKITPSHRWLVSSVSLMQSKLMRGGAIYSRIASIGL